jgi:hypothetical protein
VLLTGVAYNNHRAGCSSCLDGVQELFVLGQAKWQAACSRSRQCCTLQAGRTANHEGTHRLPRHVEACRADLLSSPLCAQACRESRQGELVAHMLLLSHFRVSTRQEHLCLVSVMQDMLTR